MVPVPCANCVICCWLPGGRYAQIALQEGLGVSAVRTPVGSVGAVPACAADGGAGHGHLTGWCAVRPERSGPEPTAAAVHEPDYFMRKFAVKTYAANGQLKSDVRGGEARHFPDTDTTRDWPGSYSLI